MRCSACGAATQPAAKFCAECGARLEWSCPACGATALPEQKFCAQCGARLPGAAAPESPPAAPPPFASPRGYTPAHLADRILKDRAALQGERKQVTVLFADVSGFTSIAEALDPEEVHGLMNRAFELMLREIHRYEGTVNQFLGDGLMALFGAPVAHEDHARRAALAALGMAGALRAYRDELMTRRIDFRVRMGLKERGHEGWAQCLLGEAASERRDRAAASAHYAAALAIARELGMQPLADQCRAALDALG